MHARATASLAPMLLLFKSPEFQLEVGVAYFDVRARALQIDPSPCIILSRRDWLPFNFQSFFNKINGETHLEDD